MQNKLPKLFDKHKICVICEATGNLLTISGKRCPHLGCALKWNQEEHSWDCPCHGSRFSQSGEVLDNPANSDASF